DAAGNASTATLIVTLSDTVPPTAAITAPASGTTVSGTSNVTASATDNVAVARVQVKLDGANLGGEQNLPPYSMPWNTTTAAGSSHVRRVAARASAGNVTTSAGAPVTVANAAAIDGSAPVISKVSTTVTASAATIGWTTNEPSTTQVEFGVAQTYGAAAPLD